VPLRMKLAAGSVRNTTSAGSLTQVVPLIEEMERLPPIPPEGRADNWDKLTRWWRPLYVNAIERLLGNTS
jgi:hypothetical protein